MFSFLYFIIFVNCVSFSDAFIIEGDVSINVSTAIVISVAGTLSIIILLWGCADLCWKIKNRSFKDFNDDAFSPELDTRMPPVSNFSMYPPAESTPRVIIEPLPDISKLRAAQSQHLNQQRLRPRIGACLERSRSESDDDIDSVKKDYNIDKTQLHTLLSSSKYQIPRSQIQYIRELGAGWFGKVIQGEGDQILPGHRKTKVVIEMLREEADEQDQLSFLQESLPFRDIDHSNVLKMLGQCVETLPYLTILEYCHFGDLKSYMCSHRSQADSFSEKGLLLKFGCDIASGLQALHEKNFVHRDLAARNCLLASDLGVKIGDYGLADTVFKDDYYIDKAGDCVPIRWLCPDSVMFDDSGGLLLKSLTKEDNIWTYGVVLWEIVQFCSLPYSSSTDDTVIHQVLQQRSLVLPKPNVPTLHADRIHSLIQLCHSEKSQRPSLRELKIMLLHLMSYREATDKVSDNFQQKWNQLMPRHSANKVMTESNAITRTPYLSAMNNIVANQNKGEIIANVTVHREAEPDVRIGEFGDWKSKAVETSQKHALSSPVNELSLEDELGALGLGVRGHADGFGNEAFTDDDGKDLQTSGGSSGWCEVTMNDTQSPVKADNHLRQPFITSTPHKSTSSDEDYLIVSRNSISESSQYKTALSSQYGSATSQGQQQSSIAALNQRNFSTWLQTVPMTLDGDDADSLSDMPSSDGHQVLAESFVTVSTAPELNSSQHISSDNHNLSDNANRDSPFDSDFM